MKSSNTRNGNGTHSRGINMATFIFGAYSNNSLIFRDYQILSTHIRITFQKALTAHRDSKPIDLEMLFSAFHP